MDETKAQDSIKAIEQMWDCDLEVERIAWMEAFAPFDSVTVAGALLKIYEHSPERPSIAEVVLAVETMQAEKQQQSSPHVRTEVEEPWVPRPAFDGDRGPISPEVAPWVKGWAVARYRHKDFRVFIQQKIGYDSHQIANPSYRTYVWPDQELMPPEDVARYIEEGSPLKAADIVSMIAS